MMKVRSYLAQESQLKNSNLLSSQLPFTIPLGYLNDLSLKDKTIGVDSKFPNFSL